MKIIFLSLLLLVTATGVGATGPRRAQKQGAPPPRTVADYVKLLPAEYVTHAGDYGPLETVVDVANGYYAVAEKTGTPDAPERDTLVPVFEFAVFRRADDGAVFVAANTIYDHACFSYETFFLGHDGARWSDVSPAVAPHLTPELFFDDPAAVAALKRHKGWRSYLRHRLPRRGTTVEVTLRLCDTDIESDDALSERDRAKLLALLQSTPKTLKLNWDRTRGRFVLAR